MGGHDDGGDDFAPQLVEEADHCHVGHGWVGSEYLFDFDCVDVGSA
jgi:hypothetical protein